MILKLIRNQTTLRETGPNQHRNVFTQGHMQEYGKKLDTNGFNNPDTELETAKDFAEALIVMMGASTDFKMSFQSLGFAPSVEEAFDKGLKKCIDAVSSAVPNQWKMKVLRLVRQAADKADEQIETRTNLAEATAPDVQQEAVQDAAWNDA